MKKIKIRNNLITVINWGLLFSLPVLLLTANIETDTASSKSHTKKLSASIIAETNKAKSEAVEVSNDFTEEEKQEEDKTVEVKEIKEQKKEDTEEETKQETKTEEKVVTPVKKEPVALATYSGTMSFYNANCTGCSGITSTGVDVSDGRLYYYDDEYQNVRIVAAGYEIKKWSIIRIKNSSLGSSVIAIVLDRGSDIGNGKKFIIDMLTNSSENKSGINKNITVEVLRNGK